MTDKTRIVTARISPKLAARLDRVTDKGLSRFALSITELVEWGLETVLPQAEAQLDAKTRRPDEVILAEKDANDRRRARREK
jgi:hypothetical protein